MLNPRIAYLCGEYPTATNTFIQREVAGLRRAGIHVETLAIRAPKPSERGGDEQQAERERTRYILPCSPWRLFLSHIRLAAAAPINYLRACWLAVAVRSPGLRAIVYQFFYFLEAGIVAAQMKKRGLVHLHNHTPDSSGYVTMIAAQMGQFTYSLTIHGFGILSEPSRWRLADKLERSLFSVCVSWNARSQAMLWTDPKHWSRFHVVHCGVDPGEFSRPVNRSHANRLLFIGRLHYVKGLPLLLQAVRDLRARYAGIHLDVAGDGPEREVLESLVREYDLAGHVKFHGYRSQVQLRDLLSRADVLIMTSLAEGVPVVLMEAMAAGVPVVAPRVGGIPELVEDRASGILFHPGHLEDLVCKVDELLSSEELRQELTARALETVAQDYQLELEVQRLAHIMQARLRGEGVPTRPAGPANIAAARVDAAPIGSVVGPAGPCNAGCGL